MGRSIDRLFVCLSIDSVGTSGNFELELKTVDNLSFCLRDSMQKFSIFKLVFVWVASRMLEKRGLGS